MKEGFQLSLKWWENVEEFKGLRALAQHTANTLTLAMLQMDAKLG